MYNFISNLFKNRYMCYHLSYNRCAHREHFVYFSTIVKL